MTKQEMAEWLAENVLGWTSEQQDMVTDHMNPYANVKPNQSRIEYYFYSPEGFFAVWDAVEKEGWSVFHLWECWEQNDGDAMKCTLEEDGPDAENPRRNVVAIGKDRYEAFYNAVYEAMKDE